MNEDGFGLPDRVGEVLVKKFFCHYVNIKNGIGLTVTKLALFGRILERTPLLAYSTIEFGWILNRIYFCNYGGYQNMVGQFKTEQESFWAGDFGSEYIKRNQGAELLASNIAFFNQSLKSARKPKDCIEFGANIGMNLRALKLLYPNQLQFGIEINPDAATELRTILPQENVFQASILDFSPQRTFDLVLIKGVLIHINPDCLPQLYEALYRSTGRYLLVCEYYNPSPVQMPYRGHSDKLFKRDFCGEILDQYPDLALIDYGFAYRRDPNFPQDDITWFLMEKRG